MRYRSALRLLAVAGALVALTVALAQPAIAAEPEMVITGEPTDEETAEIEEQWRRFLEAFGGFSDCMGPLEVRVVARAEDWYHGRNVGSIAAFYTFPPNATVIVEHRKVVPRNLLHEFTHHLDVSCELGQGHVGDEFRAAHGLPEKRGWYSGPSWKTVPAEGLAEAVVTFFGEETRFEVGADAVEVVARLTRVPDAIQRALNTEIVKGAVSSLLRSESADAVGAPTRGLCAT